MSYSFDPELAAALTLVPPLDFADLKATREMAEQVTVSGGTGDRSGVSTRDVLIAVPDSEDHRLLLRIHTPVGIAGPLPVIYDMHPGGFCVGSVGIIELRDVELAREVGAVVVAVEYRLAPEFPYPTPLEDCYTGLQWVVDHAAELGVDTQRVAVHGQSAGGGLAAALCLLARDRVGPAIAFQYLGVPELDESLATPSMTAYLDTPFWNRQNASLSWKHYLGERHGAASVPYYAAPARAADLSGLPPAYVACMQFDPLRDEGISYAGRLAQAGVPVELHLFPGTFHGSNAVSHAEVSQRELAEQVVVLRRALHG